MTASKWTAVTAACLAIMAVAVAYAMGSAKEPAAKVMRAERFELVDSAGNVTAILAADPDGLAICDPKGRTRAIVGMPLGGAPALGLLDSGGARISMDMTSDGDAQLTMFAKSGKAVVHLGVSPDGAPRLDLDGTNGRSGWTMDVPADGSGKLSLRDKAGKQVWSAP